MLKKLLKYDLKWCYKPLIVFYLLALFFAILTRGIAHFDNSLLFLILHKICAGTVIIMLINILINNFLRIWSRFIRNLYKDEAYLTHTLPVSKTTHYQSKLLTAIFTMSTSAFVILLSLAICYVSKNTWQEIQTSMEQTAIYFDSTVLSFLGVICVTLFFQMLFVIFAGFLGIIIGHRSNHLKMVKSIIWGFLFYMLPSALILAIFYGIGLFQPDIMDLFRTVNISTEALKKLLFSGILLYIVYDILYYFLGRKHLEKGVNID